MAGFAATAGAHAVPAGQPAARNVPLPTAMPPPCAWPEPPATMPTADAHMPLIADPAADHDGYDICGVTCQRSMARAHGKSPRALRP
eukprot:5247321-Pyramimonas_sp.AAC.1